MLEVVFTVFLFAYNQKISSNSVKINETKKKSLTAHKSDGGSIMLNEVISYPLTKEKLEVIACKS